MSASEEWVHHQAARMAAILEKHQAPKATASEAGDSDGDGDGDIAQVRVDGLEAKLLG